VKHYHAHDMVSPNSMDPHDACLGKLEKFGVLLDHGCSVVQRYVPTILRDFVGIIMLAYQQPDEDTVETER
jgi:hypothetical protein